jgi:hypothetical protein
VDSKEARGRRAKEEEGGGRNDFDEHQALKEYKGSRGPKPQQSW